MGILNQSLSLMERINLRAAITSQTKILQHEILQHDTVYFGFGLFCLDLISFMNQFNEVFIT